MLVTLGPGAMNSDQNRLCYHHYIHVLDPILQVIVTYYVLWSGNPGVTKLLLSLLPLPVLLLLLSKLWNYFATDHLTVEN